MRASFNPVTSKATSPASARTAASTPTPPPGSSWRRPCKAAATGPWSFSNLLNPINHARTPAEVEHYKVEPYVVCADIYGAPPHIGRGGWTWYTGSAGWLYRVAVEAIIGLRLRGNSMSLEPCVAAAWPGFEITYRHGSASYQIRVDNSSGGGHGVRSVMVDGNAAEGGVIPLHDDGRTHDVRVVLG